MSITEPIDIVLLAGGKSSRMGTNKALLPVHGMSFTEKIIKELSNVNSNIYISSSTKEMEKFGLPLIKDNHPNCGPIGGIEAAIKAINNNSWLFLTTCDMPFIKHKLILPLYNERKAYEAVVYTHNNNPEPLFGFYHSSIYNQISKAIENKEYSINKLLNKIKTNYIGIEEPAAFSLVNINTPGEYSKHILGL